MQLDVVPVDELGSNRRQQRCGTARVDRGAVRAVAEQLRRGRQAADVVGADLDPIAEPVPLIDERQAVAAAAGVPTSVSAMTSWSWATTWRSATVSAVVRSVSGGDAIRRIAPDSPQRPARAASARHRTTSWRIRPKALGGACRYRSKKPIKGARRGPRGSWRGMRRPVPLNPSPPGRNPG